MLSSAWATSCTTMDNWNSDHSLHVHNARVARRCLRAIGSDENDYIDISAVNNNPSSLEPIITQAILHKWNTSATLSAHVLEHQQSANASRRSYRAYRLPSPIQVSGHSLDCTSTMRPTTNSLRISRLTTPSTINMVQIALVLSVLQSLERFLTESLHEFNNINNVIAADVFNLNNKYTMAVVYSPPSEEVPINVFNRLYRWSECKTSQLAWRE